MNDGTLELALDLPVEPDPLPAPVAQRAAVPFTWSEAHRHACEVRYVVHTMGPARALEYCKGVEQRRGRAAAERLWRDAKALNKVNQESEQ